MARDASITLEWADGIYTFRLAWGEIILLQEARDAGPFVIHQRLIDGSWRIEDIAEVIRCGLIGGGTKPADAVKKVKLYVEQRPLLENLIFAQSILGVALAGVPDEPIKKKRNRKPRKSTASPTERSESRHYTETVP